MVAQDGRGNTFSKEAMRQLQVSWSFSPPSAIELVPPNETRQRLEPHLAALSAAAAREHYKVAVHATSRRERHPRR